MEDSRIIELYWQRNEAAIAETDSKYGRYCYRIASNILQSSEDAEEAVNDTYVGAWNAMPPHRPTKLSTFLGKITRQLSLKKLRERNAQKRGGGEIMLALCELEECVPSAQSIDEQIDAKELAEIINQFLSELSKDERRVFVRRYWYFDSIAGIADYFGFSQSKVKSMLKRTRDKLLVRLRKEEVFI